MSTNQDPPTVILSRRRRHRASQGFWLSLFVLAIAGGASLSTAVGSAVPQLISVAALSLFVLSVITWLDANLAISESWARRRREAKQAAVFHAQTNHLANQYAAASEADDDDHRQSILKQAEANRIKYQLKRGV